MPVALRSDSSADSAVLTDHRVAHIGVLVADLERARRHWSIATGSPFSPIFRYHMPGWTDFEQRELHAVDLRQSISFDTDPWIQLIEFAPNGTHGAARGEGGHHLGFPPRDGLVRRAELERLGLPIEGGSFLDGRWLIQFTDVEMLEGVATEWVESSPHHQNMKDDRSPLDALPDGTPSPFPAHLFDSSGGARPWSGIVEVGIVVADVAAAVPRWASVVDDSFDVDEAGVAVSRATAPALRLLPLDASATRCGLVSATIRVDDLEQTRLRLERARVPFEAEGPMRIAVRSGYLDGFTIRFRSD
jgi:hypothetical protein